MLDRIEKPARALLEGKEKVFVVFARLSLIFEPPKGDGRIWPVFPWLHSLERCMIDVYCI